MARWVCILALASCSSRTAPDPSAWVGLRFRDGLTELPRELSWMGESLVGPTDAGFGVTWANRRDTGSLVVLLERSDGADAPRWEVIAATELPALAERTALQTLECSVRGTRDPWVLAVVPLEPACEEVGAIGHALRFVPEGRLEPLPLGDVTCRAPCDELGGASIEGGG